MNRTGIFSSVGGTLALGALLLRNAGPAPVPPSLQPGTQASAPSTLSRSANAAGSGPDRTTKSNQKDDRLLKDGPWNASQDHFAGAWPGSKCPSPQGVPGGKKDASAQARSHLWCIPDQERVEAMIAIAPDPAHTRMALIFDRAIEAIQFAAQSSGYVADRYWLPWDLSQRTDWADYDSQQKATQGEKKETEQPGVLLFRWNGEKEEPVDQQEAKRRTQEKKLRTPTVLYVFLVTDTSTAGVNGRQFSNAVDYVTEVCAKTGESTGCAGSDPVRVMGPTFSGSLASLRRLVDAQAPRKFVAYSGTVSSACVQEDQHLLDAASPLCPLHPPDYKPVTQLQFRSLVRSTEAALTAFLDQLKKNNDIKCDGSPEVAVWSEGATSYGNATEVRATSDANATEERARPGSSPCRYTSFSYPREIASLRNAYQAAGNQKAAAPGSPYLPLSLADQSNGSDEPPDFSNPQGPLSKEAVLMSYAADMRRDHYKYIGISATNVLDTLFLANFLRSAVPDARLFVFDSDLLFERADNAPYIGALAVTTYPLLPRNSDWTGSQWRFPRLPFADQYEQGQYNASVLALGETLGRESHDTTYGCTLPCSQAQLPLWLTVVGTGGYWPVQSLAGPPAAKNAELSAQSFSGAWQVAVVLLCALAFLHAGALLTAWPLNARFRDFSLLGAEPGQRLFFIHVASASLVLALVLLGTPACRSSQRPVVLWTMLIVAVAAVLVTCVVLQLNYLLRWRQERALASSPSPADAQAATKNGAAKEAVPNPAVPLKVALQIGSSLGVWAVAGVLSCAWQRLFAVDGSYYGFFFAYRAVHMASVVSPLTPLLPLLGAFYLWAVCEVWRLRFNDGVRPRLKPSGSTTEPSLDKPHPGWLTEKSVADAIAAYSLGPAYNFCYALVFGVWFSFFNPCHAFDLFERAPFGHLFEFLFCVVMALIISSGFRMARIWRELRKLLSELNRSRVRFSFNRLKERGWSPIWRQGSEDAEWAYMVQSFECLEDMTKSEATSGYLHDATDNLQAAVQAIRQKKSELAVPARTPTTIRMMLEYFGATGTKFASRLRQLEQHLHDVQDNLAIILDRLLERQLAGSLDGRQQDRIERYVALRYAAFIRSVLGRIRLLLIFLAASFSLLMISLNVYSFEPHQALIWSVTAVFVVIGSICVVVLMQVHRDPVLSRITGTRPNELGLTFYARIISLGAVPLLTLLSAHFPAIGHTLVSFLQPGLDALK